MSVEQPLALPVRSWGRRTRAHDAWSRLGPADRIVLILFVAVFLLSMFGAFLAPNSPTKQVAEPLIGPGHGTVLGTDDIGFDVFSRILYGARQSWIGSLAVVFVGGSFGALVGLIAGAVGGWVDAVLMRLTDAFLALPAPMLAITVVAALGASFTHALMAVCIVWWPVYARIVRGEVKALASRPHLEAAKLSGVSTTRLWFRHLLPGALRPVLITASLDIGLLVLLIASLSFLGLGSADPAPELGAMVAKGLPYLLSSPWVVLYPALAVFIIALLSNLAGDATRKMLSE